MTMENKESLQSISKEDALSRLPPPLTAEAKEKLRELPLTSLPVLVVLDDDPTGTQTCHDINVLTVWDQATLVEEFQSDRHGFFILTNSRALPPDDARHLIRSICQSVQEAAKATGKAFEVVLRGDSTLRGHFPLEVEASEEILGEVDIWILAPFFEQGGRLTVDDVHYVESPEGDLVPAAQTPFARDATFGYTQSNLRGYIQEKAGGRIAADRIYSVTLEDIRVGGIAKVTSKLLSCPPRSIVIVNTVETADMDVFVRGLLNASAEGNRRFIYRTGAAFVSSRLGIQQIPPLSPIDLHMDLSSSAPGGLIIAGSYVPKTTVQLDSLVQGRGTDLETIMLDVSELLRSPETVHGTLLDAANRAGTWITQGRDVLVMTSRELVTGADELSSLKIGSAVAEALVAFLRFLVPRPRYVIAKGGITSSDAATKGLMFRRAEIAGQAASGVPIWRCSESTSKWPEIPYAVFPGNVGERDTLRDLVASWAVPRLNGTSNILGSRPQMEYARLGNSGLKVSRVILGCMTYGNPNWQGSPWVLNEADTLPLLKKAYDVGINTWETADTYSNGQSESIIGKALQVYAIPRSKVVIMTKLFYPVMEDDPDARPQPALNDGPLVNQVGLSRKHIFEAVEASLRRLNTTYIDVLQLHRLDHDTSPEEIMGALHDLVKLGKVHYLGASSMRCWQFARLQYTAKSRGWTTFSSMSGLYNLLYREEEREMIPFCQAEGIGLIPWSPNARGLLTRPWAKETDRSRQDGKAKKWFRGRGSQNELIVQRAENIARSKGCSMSAVALAWLLKKGCSPIVGLASIERIEAATEVFSVDLTDADVKSLEELYQPLEVEAI
ncbi:Aldo/keto reductase [Cryphonectria parasitica EP155]|uniref:Aldo/keto reductase n=1 Tax=Cryphonectria parasitica (strain ATCC 38755 / EP155) TaxID=660469 RepID=A0A9P5CGZ7_CRYP1|nr:Aldo/keto reductase [Cryphonectria parasitica EP155]KAF3759934.1 Aldo/keto reductase [Cryphonectria parasitica EP155]